MDNLYFGTLTYTFDPTSDEEVSYLEAFFIKKGKIVKFEVDLTVYDVRINGKKVSTVDEMLKILGNNYAKNIDKSSYYDTYTYVDHKNDLEICVIDKNYPYIYFSKIERNYSDNYSMNNLLSTNLGCSIFLIIAFYPFWLFLEPYINPLSLIYMPLIYFIIFIPSLLAVVYKKYMIIVYQIVILSILFILISIIFQYAIA